MPGLLDFLGIGGVFNEGAGAIPNTARSGAAGLLGAPADLLSLAAQPSPSSPFGSERVQGLLGPFTTDAFARRFGADLSQPSGLLGAVGVPGPEDIGRLASSGLLARQLSLPLKDLDGTPESVLRVEKLIKDQGLSEDRFGDPSGFKVLFHSGDASIANEIAQGGLQPRTGEWVREVLEGATDDSDLIRQIAENSAEVTFLSEKPNWVRIKVARKLGKDHGDVTIDDIRSHGHLAIVKAPFDSPDDILRVDNPGEVPDPFLNLLGERVNPFGEDVFTGASREPFGIEPGDFISELPLEPEFSLTGDELINFLKRNQPDQLPSK